MMVSATHDARQAATAASAALPPSARISAPAAAVAGCPAATAASIKLAPAPSGPRRSRDALGEPVDRKRDLVPPVAVRVRAGQLLAYFVRQLHRLRGATPDAEEAL